MAGRHRSSADVDCAQHVVGAAGDGVPGSPSATTTIQGDQLPAPPSKFGGVIKDLAQDSKPWWQPRIVPPQGAPNVLLIMTDDSGYGVPSIFGGVIPTPALDRIAANGLRYTNSQAIAVSALNRSQRADRPHVPPRRCRRDMMRPPLDGPAALNRLLFSEPQRALTDHLETNLWLAQQFGARGHQRGARLSRSTIAHNGEL
jgi:hypothetical protein